MRQRQIVFRNLRYHWPSHLTVVLAVAVATAVIVGSLLVGHSVRTSLRRESLERLGTVGFGAVVPAGVVEDTVERWRAVAGEGVAGFLSLSGAARVIGAARQTGVQVVGVAPRAWRLLWPNVSPPASLEGRNVWVSATLAVSLDCKVGDTLLVRVARQRSAPSHSAFARTKTSDAVGTLRCRIAGILAPGGPSAFSLVPSRGVVRNILIDRAWLQQQLTLGKRINRLVVCGGKGTRPHWQSGLDQSLRLNDFGIQLRIDKKAILLPRQFSFGALEADAIARALAAEKMAAVRSSVYLANELTCVKNGETHRVPYSTIVGREDGPSSDSLSLNAWAAAALRARPGDSVSLRYYQSQADGSLREETVSLVVDSIVPMKVAQEWPNVVPDYPGLTDARRLGDWDPPFPMDLSRIREEDEAYWDTHRALPKAVLNLSVVQRMWDVAGRMPEPIVSAFLLDSVSKSKIAGLSKRLSQGPLGIPLQALRADALRAAQGSTDFSVLFLSLGFFLVAAAAALVGLLFRMQVEQRSRPLGLLLAVGYGWQDVRSLLLKEMGVVAGLGCFLGLLAGTGYAALILWALEGGWSGAVAGTALTFCFSYELAFAGALAGWMVAMASLCWGGQAIRHVAPRALLAGEVSTGQRWQPLWVPRLRLPCVVLAILTLGAGLLVDRSSLAIGCFLSAGFLGLLLGMLQVTCRLTGYGRTGAGRFDRKALLWRGLSFRPFRTIVSTAIVACAVFVLVAVAANRKADSAYDLNARGSGSGGFRYLVRLAVPLRVHPGTEAGRKALGLPEADALGLKRIRIDALPVRRGEDISCHNLRQPRAPEVIGVPLRWLEEQRFVEGASWPQTFLAPPNRSDDVPCVADGGSAQWILKARPGDRFPLPGSATLRLDGVLRQNLFQGAVLVPEPWFEKRFSDGEGYSLLLVEGTADKQDLLERAFSPYGPEIETTAAILAGYARVQNTYLSAFATLSGLGLVLGALGVAAVMMRNVLSREGEFALLRAAGFTRRSLYVQVLTESGLQLVLGVALGAASATVAVLPLLAGEHGSFDWQTVLFACLGAIVSGLLACAVATRWALSRSILQGLRRE